MNKGKHEWLCILSNLQAGAESLHWAWTEVGPVVSCISQLRWDAEEQRKRAGIQSHYSRIIWHQPTALGLKAVSSAVLHRSFFHEHERADQYSLSLQHPVAAVSFILLVQQVEVEEQLFIMSKILDGQDSGCCKKAASRERKKTSCYRSFPTAPITSPASWLSLASAKPVNLTSCLHTLSHF